MFRKSLTIELVEPVVYLRGQPKDKHTINILRGLIRLQLSHPTIIQSVTIQFIGTAKTLWPEATHHWDKHILVDSTIPICRSPIMLKKGMHVFPFEILLSNALSESVECGLGHVRYKLLCQVNMKSTTWLLPFLSQLKQQKSIVLIRLPSPQDNLPRCINQIHTLETSTPYHNEELHVLIESAHITPGKPIALCFSFSKTPLSIDHVSVKLIERQKFRARAKKTTRILHHEITLLPNHPDQIIKTTDELRCLFQVPDKETLQVHPSTSNSNIRVRHWIQITLRFILQDGTPKEIIMDAPISVLLDSIDYYITLPPYNQHPLPSSLLSSSTQEHQTTTTSSSSLLLLLLPNSTPSKSWFNKLNPRRSSWLGEKKEVPPPKYDAIVWNNPLLP